MIESIKRCIIIGGGASIRQNLWDTPIEFLPIWQAIKNEVTFSINWSYKWHTPTVAMYGDYRFYGNERGNLVKKCPLVVGFQDSYYVRKGITVEDNVFLLRPADGVEEVKGEGSHKQYWGKDSWKRGFYSSQLTGLFSLTFAIVLGFKEIYLLGMDGCESQGRTHFYQGDNDRTGYVITDDGREQTGMGKNDTGFNTQNYNKNAPEPVNWLYRFYPKVMDDEKISIFNVSPNSVLEAFPKLDYNGFYNNLQRNKSNINQDLIRAEIIKKIKDNI